MPTPEPPVSASDETAKGDVAPVGHGPAPAPRRSLFIRCASTFGLLTLGYLLGAVVMFFDLPTSSFLRRAFVGGAAWYQVENEPPPARQAPLLRIAEKIDRPDRTCDGFTL